MLLGYNYSQSYSLREAISCVYVHLVINIQCTYTVDMLDTIGHATGESTSGTYIDVEQTGGAGKSTEHDCLYRYAVFNLRSLV